MTDAKTLRLVVLFVGLVVLGVVAGSFVLLAQGKTLDAALVGLGGVGLGYLGGVLTPSSHNEPVPVVAPEGQPLPVDPVETGGYPAGPTPAGDLTPPPASRAARVRRAKEKP